jgi:hypothetical protein
MASQALPLPAQLLAPDCRHYQRDKQALHVALTCPLRVQVVKVCVFVCACVCISDALIITATYYGVDDAIRCGVLIVNVFAVNVFMKSAAY